MFDDGFIIQCIGQVGDNLNVFVVMGCNINYQMGNVIFFFIEVYVFWVLVEYYVCFQYVIFCFNCIVWYCDRFIQISWGQFFMIQYCLNVFWFNVIVFYQLFVSKMNCFFFGCCFVIEEDVFCVQFEQVSIGIVKVVFQIVFYFYFVFSMVLGSNQMFGQVGVQVVVEEVGQ